LAWEDLGRETMGNEDLSEFVDLRGSLDLLHVRFTISLHFMTFHDISWHFMTFHDISWHFMTFGYLSEWCWMHWDPCFHAFTFVIKLVQSRRTCKIENDSGNRFYPSMPAWWPGQYPSSKSKELPQTCPTCPLVSWHKRQQSAKFQGFVVKVDTAKIC
jgi:hypothetical protein